MCESEGVVVALAQKQKGVLTAAGMLGTPVGGDAFVLDITGTDLGPRMPMSRNRR
jgi:hypothetical protein